MHQESMRCEETPEILESMNETKFSDFFKKNERTKAGIKKHINDSSNLKVLLEKIEKKMKI